MSRRLGLAAAIITGSLLSPAPVHAATAFHAGSGMTSPISSTRVAICTDGFHGVNDNGVAVIITAGHCGEVGSVWSSNGGTVLGKMTQRRFVKTAGEDDFAIVRNAGKVGLGATVRDAGSIKYVDRLGVPKRGQRVCTTGKTSGTRCGRITRVKSNGIIITNIVSRHGDSGGPLFRRIPDTRRVVALGVLSYGDTSTYSAFQRLSEVLNKTGIRLKIRR